jgi:hypothetical protein
MLASAVDAAQAQAQQFTTPYPSPDIQAQLFLPAATCCSLTTLCAEELSTFGIKKCSSGGHEPLMRLKLLEAVHTLAPSAVLVCSLPRLQVQGLWVTWHTKHQC